MVYKNSISFCNSSNTHMGTPSLSALWLLHEVTYPALVNTGSWRALLIIIYLILLFSLTFRHVPSTKTLEQAAWLGAGGFCSVLIRIIWVASDRSPSQTSWGKRRSVLAPRSLVQTCSLSGVSVPFCTLDPTSPLLDWPSPRSRRQHHTSHLLGFTPEELSDAFSLVLSSKCLRNFSDWPA